MRNEATGSYRRIAYLVSWFPTVTETFILYEVLALKRLGMHVEVFPLLGRHGYVNHPGSEELVSAAHYRQFFSWATLTAQFYWLRRAPRAYVGAWWMALRGNLRSPGFLLRALFVVPKAALFAREISSLRIEHIHAHWATHPTLAAMVIRRLTGLSFSFTCHAHDLFVDRTMLRQKLEAASLVVTISEFNKRLLAGLYGPCLGEKIEVVRCGIDPTAFRPPTRRRRHSVPLLLCVASLRDYKGHAYLIEACRALRKRGQRFRLLLVGDGPERERLERQLRRAQLTHCVRLLGSQSRTVVARLLRRVDLVVQPSIVTPSGQMEGIPVSLMEALASEVPVIATRISAVPELIQHERTGLLVPDRDAESLARAITRLVRDPALSARLARTGRERVLQEFNLWSNARRLHDLLTGLTPIAREQPLTATSAPSHALRSHDGTRPWLDP